MRIDFLSVAANGLWILGLSLILAVISWTHWVASRKGAHFQEILNQRQRTVYLAMALVCGGLAATTQGWWERGLWLLLTAAWTSQIVLGSYGGDRDR